MAIKCISFKEDKSITIKLTDEDYRQMIYIFDGERADEMGSLYHYETDYDEKEYKKSLGEFIEERIRLDMKDFEEDQERWWQETKYLRF